MGVMKRLNTMGSSRSSGAFGVTTRLFFDRAEVQRRLAPATLKYLRRSGGYTRRVARSLIKRKGHARKKPSRKYIAGTERWTKSYRRWVQEVRTRPASEPGTPPYTHTDLLRKSIMFALSPTTESVVVGPEASHMDDIGKLHEHGGTRKGKRYPARPYMQPALERTAPKLPEFWRASIQ